jgi:diadenosine tetraphosphate (Ap4A) HIT family hydrolase
MQRLYREAGAPKEIKNIDNHANTNLHIHFVARYRGIGASGCYR